MLWTVKTPSFSSALKRRPHSASLFMGASGLLLVETTTERAMLIAARLSGISPSGGGVQIGT